MCILIKVTVCEADSTTQYDSESTVCYSSDESGPLFVEDTYSDSDMEQSNEQEQHSNESRYCKCKEKVNTVTEN